MNTETVALIQVLIPTITTVLVYFYHQIFQRLPEKKQEEIKQQQEALKIFVPAAVHTAEQITSPEIPGEAKKAIAISTIKKLFVEFKLPVPSDTVLGTLIESAVHVMKTVSDATVSAPTTSAGPQWLGQEPPKT